MASLLIYSCVPYVIKRPLRVYSCMRNGFLRYMRTPSRVAVIFRRMYASMRFSLKCLLNYFFLFVLIFGILSRDTVCITVLAVPGDDVTDHLRERFLIIYKLASDSSILYLLSEISCTLSIISGVIFLNLPMPETNSAMEIGFGFLFSE